MPQSEIIITHQGLMSFEIIGALLNRLKIETEKRAINISQYKKLLSIMIEALENIYKYNEYFEHETSFFPEYYPSIVIVKDKNKYILTASNPIQNKDISKLKIHLDKINNVNREGLRQLFRDTLTNGKFTLKGGAGLGFIEMSKISGNKLDYSFKEINQFFSFFSYNITLIINE